MACTRGGDLEFRAIDGELLKKFDTKSVYNTGVRNFDCFCALSHVFLTCFSARYPVTYTRAMGHCSDLLYCVLHILVGC